MLGLRVTVPVACWRKGRARELLETELLPPPATCYGFLLSLVGECDRERHRGARVSAGLLGAAPERSMVLRTLWRIKDRKRELGAGENRTPDYQQLLTGSDLVIWCDSTEEVEEPTLEARLAAALQDPAAVSRFGGLSLGESTHLVNDIWFLPDGEPPGPCLAFLQQERGDLNLPVWVDHVGTAGTRYAVGRLIEVSAAPPRERLPGITPH
ncbi:MAG: CRISPR-associated protein Cas5 [Acidobacteria bacterium ADurb.Bin051]|jgi:CRISPR-associated protein Cas5t|nr:MAG: CRISPR-associated protein Cas5 [Acidobacteria bacterium ADurb.Bin051]